MPLKIPAGAYVGTADTVPINSSRSEKMYKAIIFDFDGVLVNTTSNYVKAFHKVLKANNITADDNELKSHFGKPVLEIMAECVPKKNKVGDAQKLASEFHEEVSRKWFMDDMALFPKTENILQELKKQGLLLAIASGTNSAFLIRFLDYLNIRKYFNVVLGSNDVKNCKPYPEIALKAVDSLGITAQDALYIGDAKADVSVAKGANVASAIVLTGVLNREEAEKLSPDYILKDLSEIWRILGK